MLWRNLRYFAQIKKIFVISFYLLTLFTSKQSSESPSKKINQKLEIPIKEKVMIIN